MAGVSLRNIAKRFGAVGVLHDVSLEVEDGELVVFVGPSGCGKSTLLRIIAGLEDSTSGEVFIGERMVNDVEPADRGIAMVFQSYALYPHMTVERNLSFGLRMTGNDKADTEKRVRRAAETLRIEELMQRRPKQLSGGQRQRVAIGRAIVRKPGVFLFDEPLSNLDAELRVQMRVELSRLHKELRSTMIYVTHDQTEAMTLADKIVVLRAGKVEQIGPPLDLYADPDNRFVAGFMGSPRMNFMAGKVVRAGEGGMVVELINQHGATLNKRLSGSPPGEGSAISVGVRPEHFGAPGEGDCDLAVTVDVAEHLGSTSYLYANTIKGEELVIQSNQSKANAIRNGKTVVSVRAEHAFMFAESGARLR